MKTIIAIRLCFILVLLMGMGALLMGWLAAPKFATMQAEAIRSNLSEGTQLTPASMTAIDRGHDIYRSLWLGYGAALTLSSSLGLFFTTFPSQRQL